MQSPYLSPTGVDADAAELSWSERITRYDAAHLFTYAQLLDAEAAGASPKQMMECILGLDAERAASEVELSHHLERARWMRRTGYRLLLSERDGGPIV